MLRFSAGKLFLKFIAWMLPAFLVLTAVALYSATEFTSRKDLDNLSARVGNHAGRIAVALGRHDLQRLQQFGYDLLGSLLADPAVFCAELNKSSQQTPVLSAPRGVGCNAQRGLEKLYIPIGPIGNDNSNLTVYFSTQEVSEALRTQRIAMIMILLAGMAVALLAGALGFRQTIGKPLAALEKAIRGNGDGTDTAIVTRHGNDELGVVIQAYNELQAGLRSARHTAESEAARRAREQQRALQAEMIASGIATFQRDVVEMIDQLNERVSQISSVSSQLNDASIGVTRAVDDLGLHSRKNAADSSDVTIAFERLTGNIDGITAHIRQTLDAGDTIRQSRQKVRERIGDLTHSVEQIGEAAELIGKIAQQTNLLSLNATIEAARAGAAGRGFSVVATEVKTLSLDTARAAISIKQAIEQIGEELAHTRRAAETLEEAASLIDDSSAFVGEALNQQEKAIQDINEAAGSSASTAHRIAENLGGILQLARHSEGAASDVTDASLVLQNIANRLQVAVDKLRLDLAA